MKRFIFNTVFFTIFTISCFAQSSASSVISNLKVTIKSISNDNATISLNWKIPKKNDITEFIIYRNTKQLTKEQLSQLTPIETLKGKYTSYFDTVKNLSEEYYYAVLTKNRNGEIFRPSFSVWKVYTSSAGIAGLDTSTEKNLSVHRAIRSHRLSARAC